jgi:hypothetical protein
MKQMEVTKKKIGDNTFYIKPFGAFTAANITGLLAKTIGPLVGGMGGLLKNGTTVDEIMNSDMGDMLPGLGNALSEIEPSQLESLIKKLIVDYKNVSINGEITGNEAEILNFDLANEVFCGDLMGMLELCVEVCKVNFGGFFKKLGIQSGDLQGYMGKVTMKLTNGESSTQEDSAN